MNPDCLLKVLGSSLELSLWLDDERIVMIQASVSAAVSEVNENVKRPEGLGHRTVSSACTSLGFAKFGSLV